MLLDCDPGHGDAPGSRPAWTPAVLRRADAVAGGAELVGGEQVHDAGNAAGLRPAQDRDRGAQLHGGQFVHTPSLPVAGAFPR